MPLAIPRTGFTILDSHSDKLLRRYGLSLTDFFHGEEALREHLAARLAPQSLTAALGEAASALDGAIEGLRREIASFDPTLAVALDRSARKMRYQLNKVERKAGREALRRDARAAQDAASLFGLLYPERHLQERLYSILPFLAKHGLDLVDHVYDAIQLDCADHRLMVL
jgi:bacillithiol synthase